ncbi:MAG: short-chain dehydrogenase/oxidoreductase [Ilumatobacteraceae bacterium]|nr:short-chain dehydrogenase/oxidoreductase [Ilumatobacteraceae bacterium]
MVERAVVVVIGAGGMGVACARRLGLGTRLLLADSNGAVVDRVALELRRDGFDVERTELDVVDAEAVRGCAALAASMGPLASVVHTAGLSPTMADAARILAVDLVGTANVIDAFEAVVGQDCVGVCVASMAGSLTDLDRDLERQLATLPTAELAAVAEASGITDPATAYGYAKRANQLRVEAAASRWGDAGARIVSVSPGIMSTGMGHQELASETFGGVMRSMIEASPVRRIGTADDVAATVEWLCSRSASFISGTDIRMDGGVTAAMRWGA